MSRNVFEQLKDLKTDPRAGWAPDSVRKQEKTRLMEAIGDNRIETQLQASQSFFRWNFVEFVSMPATIVAAALVLVFGGSMTTVNAASNSLPGDALYGLKMITEQTKLKLASIENKAMLHTEFAQNRLEEAAQLHERGDLESAQVALDAFKSELQAASNELERLQGEGSQETLAVAAELNSKIEELNSSSNENDSDAAQIATVTKETANAVVDVVVEEHETQASEQSEKDLHGMFKEEYNAMNQRKIFDLGRVSMIAEVIEVNDLDVEINTRALENNIKEATAEVPDAMNYAAAGGYRTAFELLRTADANLINVEVKLAEAEIAIMEAMNPPEVVEEEIIEDQNEEILNEEEVE